LIGYEVVESYVPAYFCPLKSAYYYKIKDGSQNCEIRPCGHHGWNPKHIYVGRHINFSKGYGKQERILKQVLRTVVTSDLERLGVPLWHIQAVEAIYGQRLWLCAFVEDIPITPEVMAGRRVGRSR